MSEQQMIFQSGLASNDCSINDDDAAIYEKYYKQFVNLAEQAGIPPEESADLARASLVKALGYMRRELPPEKRVSEKWMAQFARNVVATYVSNQERGIRRHRAKLRERQHNTFIVELRPPVFLLISGLISFAVLKLLTNQELVIALGTFNFGIIGMWALAYLSKILSLNKARRE